MPGCAKLGRVVAACLMLAVPLPALAQQDSPVQRVANIVSVAVEEYGKAVDPHDRLISLDEYQETVGFVDDARAAECDSDYGLPGFPTMEALGLFRHGSRSSRSSSFPGLFLIAVAKRFWPGRSVMLPTLVPDANGSAALTTELARLRVDNEALAAREASLDALPGQVDETNQV